MLFFSFCPFSVFAYVEGSQLMCLSLPSHVFCGVDECSAAINFVSGVPQPRIHLSERHHRELILNQSLHAVMQLGEANSVCVCVLCHRTVRKILSNRVLAYLAFYCYPFSGVM